MAVRNRHWHCYVLVPEVGRKKLHFPAANRLVPCILHKRAQTAPSNIDPTHIALVNIKTAFMHSEKHKTGKEATHTHLQRLLK